MDIKNRYITIAYGYEIEDQNLLNSITRTIGYMKDNGYTDKEILHYLIRTGPYISDELFNGLTDYETVYYNNELVIESDAPVWHPENGNLDRTYYREPRCRFDIEDLLNLFYNKLKVPVELRDKKRDIGGLNHLLNKYKFSKFSTVDFIITLIKIAEDNELRTCNVFDVEQYADEAYDMFMYLVNSNRTRMIWRVK